jgi:hypothetical protein
LKEAFHEYLVQEKSSENLDFIEAVLQYTTTGSKTVSEQISGLLEIYETFIKLQSKKEINIKSSMRKKFEKKIEPQLAEKNDWILEESSSEVFRLFFFKTQFLKKKSKIASMEF